MGFGNLGLARYRRESNEKVDNQVAEPKFNQGLNRSGSATLLFTIAIKYQQVKLVAEPRLTKSLMNGVRQPRQSSCRTQV